MASIGHVQLLRFDSIYERRQTLAKHYVTRLSQNKNIRLLPLDYNSVVPHIFVIELLNSISREKIREILDKKNIQTGIHWHPNHWLTFYKQYNSDTLPITDQVFKRLITLPLHADLQIKDVDYVCDTLLSAL